MPSGAFIEPENALCPKHRFRKLMIQKVLEFLDIEGLIPFNGNRGKPIVFEVVGVVVMVVIVSTVPMVMVAGSMIMGIVRVVVMRLMIMVVMGVRLMVMMVVPMVVMIVIVFFVLRLEVLIGLKQADTQQK